MTFLSLFFLSYLWLKNVKDNEKSNVLYNKIKIIS